jgi:hypothetical protein
VRARALLRRLAACLRPDRGGASAEFVVVFPGLVAILVMSMEASIYQMRQLMLERGLDLTTRELRLRASEDFDAATVRRDICEHARILPDCTLNLLVQMIPIDSELYAMPADGAPCREAGAPGSTPHPVALPDEQIVLVRACYGVAPMFPSSTLGLTLTENGARDVRMTATSAFMIEPEEES